MKKYLFSKVRTLLAITMALPLIVTSCQKEGLDPIDYSNGGEKLTVLSPQMSYEILTVSDSSNLSNSNFTSSFNESSAYIRVYAKQNGKVYEYGKCTGTLSSDKKSFDITPDLGKQIDTSKSYDIYISQKELTVRNNTVFYKRELQRGGSFHTLAKASKTNNQIQSVVDGTVEVVYVANKSDQPIKFVHKGFEADEKWYYQEAEVNMDNNSVVNGTQVSTEASSEERNCNNGKLSPVYSFYIPNGKKINNAILVAEIDGKQVRTSNTLTSDLTLQPGHAYAYVVEWDGKELKFEGGVKVIDLSNPQESGIDVVGYSFEDNALVIKTTKDKVPEIGEYIVSGITEVAPCGFLLKANSVKDCGDGAFVIFTQPATLHEVLKAKGVKYKGWLKLESSDAKTRATDVLDESINKTPIIKMPLVFKKKDKQKDPNDPDKTINNGEFQFTLNEELYFVEDDCGYFVDSENESTQGFNFTLLQTETWNIYGKLNAYNFDEEDLAKESKSKVKWYKQYVVGAIAGVPVVVTPKFEIKFPLKMNISLNANMDIKKTSTLYHVGAKWDGLGPAPIFDNGSYIYSEDVTIPDDKLPQSQQSQLQMTAEGTFSLKWVNSLTVGLYGGNLTDEERVGLYTDNPVVKKYIMEHIDNEFEVSYMTIGADFSIGTEGKVKLGFENSAVNAPQRYHNDFRLIDSFDFRIFSDLTLKLIAWEIKSGLFSWKCESEHELGSSELIHISFPIILKDFKKIKLTTLEDGRIKVTGTVKHPLANPNAWNTKYGICLERYGRMDYQEFPLEDSNIHSGLFYSTFEYILPWKVHELVSGETYAIYPYIQTDIGTYYRKGITFIPTANGLKYNSIDDLPGQNL